MKNFAAVVGTALAVGLAAVGCSSSTGTQEKTGETAAATTTSVAATASAAETTSAEANSVAPQADGQTLDQYLTENNINKAIVKLGAGPTVDLPVPPGWSKSEPTLNASYGGLVVTDPVSKDDAPRIDAHMLLLTGNVDQAQVLALASSSLKQLPGFQTLGDVTDKQFSGFPAAQAGGSYTKDGNTRLVAQKSVVIPGDGGVYLLQLTADGLESDMHLLMDATSAIDKETTITP